VHHGQADQSLGHTFAQWNSPALLAFLAHQIKIGPGDQEIQI
jgi:hypothetical protein